MNFSYRDRAAILTGIASRSIAHGLAGGEAHVPALGDFDAALREKRATFVTLHRDGALRGCIGTLEAYRPLVLDVAEHAFAAAFRDPRFPPVTAAEAGELAISISILSLSEDMNVRSEAELLAALRPGVDGLVLSEGSRRATFLPAVWESLPDKEAFVRELKRKAGWRTSYWSPSLKASRYTVEEVG